MRAFWHGGIFVSCSQIGLSQLDIKTLSTSTVRPPSRRSDIEFELSSMPSFVRLTRAARRLPARSRALGWPWKESEIRA